VDSTGSVARAVIAGLPAATAAVALVTLAILLLPMPDAPEEDASVRRSVDVLCTSPDSDSLAPFTRRRDKSYVFASDGRAVIGYRVVHGVCIAGPGPVGAADAHADALAAFVQRCNDRGWRPAMIGADDHDRGLARRYGLRGIRIGDEAVLRVAEYRLDQPAMRNVRQAVKRTRNAGVSVSVHREAELSIQLRAALGEVLHDWRRGAGELGFTMTLDQLLNNTYPDAVIVVAHHNGHPVGFQRYVSCHGGACMSLDVMPRLRHAPNGINERLITEAIDWGSANGVDQLSLNFAAFRTLFEARQSTTRRPLRWAVHRLDPLINVESLYRFNAKFRPGWVPRHVLYRSVVDLPFILYAALRLEFGHRREESSADAVWAPLHSPPNAV
jgi:lysyl-tRNA synthetase class 2